MLPSLASLQIGVNAGEKRKLEESIPDDVDQEEFLLELLLQRQKKRIQSEKDRVKEEAEARRSQMEKERETQKRALEQRLIPFGAKINDTKLLVVLDTVDVLIEKTQEQDRHEVPDDGIYDKTYMKTIKEGAKYTVYVDRLSDEYVCLRLKELIQSNYRKFTLKLFFPWALFEDKKVAFE